MSIWKWLFGGEALTDALDPNASAVEFNPASGLPMINGCGGVDVGGSPYGMDWQKNDFSSPISHFNAGGDIGAGFDNDWPD